ncbi:hypothetical protein RFI_00122 [Reticulomyxa filosa]|uniref:protein-tyrosine-phosphatase n=1 Tax=Reticulomyxa filosa TaxID=46433 RepID=X6PEN3_RETFI|nr:hypothetical protein RFI_00122 [Reticulomyxa filosa]|eukprot:ETO36940.1 hypothetical protein RFI_00122 [Reticulomyxa filosa]
MTALSAAESNEDIEQPLHAPTKILDYLYLGDKRQAYNEKLLQTIGITHIFACISTFFSQEDNKVIQIKCSPMDDRGNSNLPSHVAKAIKFVKKAQEWEAENKVPAKILVYCSLSVNRSPSLVLGILMELHKMTLKEAYKFVSSKHSKVCIHDKYMSQLREFDKQIFGEYSTKENELPTTSSVMAEVVAKLRQNQQDDSME